MRTITGLFDSRNQAETAVRSLRDAGVPDGDISIITNNVDGSHDVDGDEAAKGVGTGAGVGAVVGGTGGLLAGLGMLAIPGVGPVVAGGWLLATAIGAVTGAAVGGATGGIMAALVEAGVDEGDAHVYAEGLRRGGTLVTARVEDSRADAAQAILRNASGVEASKRRAEYETEGWKGFDESADPYSEDEIRNYHSSIRRGL